MSVLAQSVSKWLNNTFFRQNSETSLEWFVLTKNFNQQNYLHEKMHPKVNPKRFPLTNLIGT